MNRGICEERLRMLPSSMPLGRSWPTLLSGRHGRLIRNSTDCDRSGRTERSHQGIDLPIVQVPLAQSSGSGSLSCPFTNRGGAPLPFAARNFRRERVQLRLPETAELSHPSQDRLKSRGINRIESSLRVRPDLREVTLAQN